MAATDRLPVFVDTGPWIALLDLSDQWHRRALEVMASLRAQKRPLVTSNLVLMEACTGLVGRIRRSGIARFRDAVQMSLYTRVERVDDSIEESAWQIFFQYDDKAIGMVDCTSFVIMNQLGLSHAFTFDRHFRQMGFRTFPPLK